MHDGIATVYPKSRRLEKITIEIEILPQSVVLGDKLLLAESKLF